MNAPQVVVLKEHDFSERTQGDPSIDILTSCSWQTSIPTTSINRMLAPKAAPGSGREIPSERTGRALNFQLHGQKLTEVALVRTCAPAANRRRKVAALQASDEAARRRYVFWRSTQERLRGEFE